MLSDLWSLLDLVHRMQNSRTFWNRGIQQLLHPHERIVSQCTVNASESTGSSSGRKCKLPPNIGTPPNTNTDTNQAAPSSILQAHEIWVGHGWHAGPCKPPVLMAVIAKYKDLHTANNKHAAQQVTTRRCSVALWLSDSTRGGYVVKFQFWFLIPKITPADVQIIHTSTIFNGTCLFS